MTNIILSVKNIKTTQEFLKCAMKMDILLSMQIIKMVKRPKIFIPLQGSPIQTPWLN